MPRAPLPDTLGSPFTVRDAAAAGVARSRLRANDLETPFRGVRVKGDVPIEASDEKNEFELRARAVRRRACAYALVMPPNQFFSHVTAAILWMLPVPAYLLLPGKYGEPAFVDTLDVGVLAPLRPPRARGIRGHQIPITHASHRRENGLRVASPASTWAMLASVIKNRRDIVALGDAVVRERIFANDPPALATLENLEAAVLAGRRRGIGMLRDALPLIRTRSASSRETWCRLTLIEAGLPEPELNWSVWQDGWFMACVDLAYPRLKIAIEYEGEHHLTDPEQWAKDIERHARLVELGWIVIRVTKQQLETREALVQRVARAIAARS